MSIAEFTKALRDNANSQITQDAKRLLDSFVRNANDAFTQGGIRKKASIISEGKATVSGKSVNLTEEFRKAGEKQGRTRLVLTEDDLKDIFQKFNISSSDANPIALYAKFLASQFSNKMARHFEVYLRDGSVIEKGKLPISTVINNLNVEDIIAIRGLNFSHENTVVHVAHFLHYINAFPGSSRKDIEKILLADYDRGHVYAQTYGRAIISAGDLIQEENILTQIIQLYALLDEGSTSLNRMDGKYNELLARSKKDFTSKNIAMNIQLQLKRDISGTGNRDTGDLSSYVRIVGFLQSLVKNSRLSADGKRQLGIPAAVSLKEFEKTLTDFNKKLEKYSEQISKVLAKTGSPDYLLNLRTSDTAKDYFIDSVKSTLDGNQIKPLSVDTGNVSILKQKASIKIKKPSLSVNSSISSIKKDLQKLKSTISKPKSTKIPKPVKSLISLDSLLVQINSNLHDQIKRNMGTGSSRDVLNYRTGRFAQSARVERLSESRQGMITAFYSYMKNPYATFSRGGRQDRPYTRDPKLLISKSIRELAGQQVANRMRAVLV